MMARLLLVALALTLCACSGRAYEDMAGNSRTLDQFRGRWLVLNYWAIWCEPCRDEVPELNRLARTEKDRLAVLGVNFDLPPLTELAGQARSLGIEFPVLIEDPAPELGVARPEVLPMTVLVDPGGAVATVLEGPQTADSILAAIERQRGRP